MENQQQQPPPPPTNRPWFRLASQARIEPPQTRPAPPVRPAFVPVPRPSIVIPSQPQPRPAPTTRTQEPAPPTQTQGPAQSAAVPPSATDGEPMQMSSALPPSPQQKSLASTSSVPSTPLITSSLPTTPFRKTQEPEPYNGAPPATKVNSPPKLPASSSPTSPIRKVSEPTPSNNSPPAKPVESPPKVVSSSLPAFQMQRAISRVPSPPESPKIIKPSSGTPPQSPKVIPSAPPPSPLSLPPSQLRATPEPGSKSLVAEQKNMLIQERKEKFDGREHEEDKSHIGQNGKKEGGVSNRHKEKEHHKKLDDHKDSGMRVITIAGDNKGAYMELGSANRKHDYKGNPHTLSHNSRTKNDGNESVSSSSSSSEKGKSKKKDKSKSGLPMTAFVNSNVQSVNNSILFHTSCTHSDPGVHFSFSRKPNVDQGIHPGDA